VEVHLRRLQRQAAEGADRHCQLKKKVAVIGNTGSGKTTFARALAQKLGVPHIELDALHWKSGWVMSSPEEVRRVVDDALAGDGWVIDGNWGSTLGTTVLAAADEVVWLDLPLRTTLPRLWRRTWRRVRTREPLWDTTNRETFRKAFLSRDSILLFQLRTHRSRRRRYAERLENLPHVRLRSAREVAEYLA
jgi:adenylate kinase family enzyme